LKSLTFGKVNRGGTHRASSDTTSQTNFDNMLEQNRDDRTPRCRAGETAAKDQFRILLIERADVDYPKQPKQGVAVNSYQNDITSCRARALSLVNASCVPSLRKNMGLCLQGKSSLRTVRQHWG